MTENSNEQPAAVEPTGDDVTAPEQQPEQVAPDSEPNRGEPAPQVGPGTGPEPGDPNDVERVTQPNPYSSPGFGVTGKFTQDDQARAAADAEANADPGTGDDTGATADQ